MSLPDFPLSHLFLGFNRPFSHFFTPFSQFLNKTFFSLPMFQFSFQHQNIVQYDLPLPPSSVPNFCPFFARSHLVLFFVCLPTRALCAGGFFSRNLSVCVLFFFHCDIKPWLTDFFLREAGQFTLPLPPGDRDISWFFVAPSRHRNGAIYVPSILDLRCQFFSLHPPL